MKKNNETSMIKPILDLGNSVGLFRRRNTGAASYSGVNGKKRFVRYGSPGDADIEGVINGYHISIELKSGNKKQTKKQLDYESLVVRNGGYYFLVRSVDEGIEAILSVFDEVIGIKNDRKIQIKQYVDLRHK